MSISDIPHDGVLKPGPECCMPVGGVSGPCHLLLTLDAKNPRLCDSSSDTTLHPWLPIGMEDWAYSWIAGRPLTVLLCIVYVSVGAVVER